MLGRRVLGTVAKLTQQKPLITTASVALSWTYPSAKNYARTPDDTIEEVVKVEKAFAAVAHTRRHQDSHLRIVEACRGRIDV